MFIFLNYIKKILRKLIIEIHKYINYDVFRNNVILFGIPNLIKKENIVLGHNVRINDNVFIHGGGGVEIRKNTTLSYGVSIISTGYDTKNWNLNKIRKQHLSEKIVIGENVWVCANVTILSGVTIKDDIIIAAGSVVKNDLLSSGFLYAGVPAKKIKKL